MSRYIQLKESGELKKIRQFRNLTIEEQLERFERNRLDRTNRKSASAYATIRLINAHAQEHRELIRDESQWLKYDRTFARNSFRFENEVNRRATLVLRYDHSYEYSKYYDQELHALKGGWKNHSDMLSARKTAKLRKNSSYVLAAAACLAALVMAERNFFPAGNDGQITAGSADPTFEVIVGPLQVSRLVNGLEVSVDSIHQIPIEDQPVSAMSDSLPPVRIDHDGERKPIPSDPTKRCPEFHDLFAKYGMYPIETWSYIAWRESRCNPLSQNAEWDENGNMTYHLNQNKTYDTGLLQINSGWKKVTREICGDDAVNNYMSGLKNPDCNILVARYIMEHSSGGLSNWSL
jgi:hypothetical protein